MVREIVFDTETTGMDPETGDKLVEIGAIELINHLPTGVTFHRYINPQREVPDEAFKVHGLNYDFLKNHPIFADIVDEWIDFVGDAILVAHNAPFDMKFINFEQKELGRITYGNERVIDTLEIARKLFPGQRNNLDALCKRFDVDNSERTLHGALLDADLLAKVYLELLGGQEPTMLGNEPKKHVQASQFIDESQAERKYREPRVFALSEEEEKAHIEFMEKNLKEPVWLKTGEENNG